MEKFIPALLGYVLIFSILLLNGVLTAEEPTAVAALPAEPIEVLAAQDSKPSNSNSTKLQDEELRRKDFHLGPVMTNWDEERAKWLEENPRMRLNRKGKPRMILVTSSQTDPCPSPKGDHFLVKAMKNKLDYTQLHDIELYYNMVVMDPTMTGFFIKHPMVRKLMVAHPEAEWIWWMDSDAFFTDMTFEIPFEKYADKNLIVHGWDGAIYKDKNWVGLNAGIFLIRNCQWSLTMLDTWAGMGEDFDGHLWKMGALATKALSGRPEFPLDDQSALVYLLTTDNSSELRPHVQLENSYALHGFWVWAMGKHDELLKESPERKPEKEYWPFITHFVGCKSCSGSYASYDLDLCLSEMERAFNIADNQMLHMFGFEHKNLSSHDVTPTRLEWRRPLDFLKRSVLDFLLQNPWSPTSSLPGDKRR